MDARGTCQACGREKLRLQYSSAVGDLVIPRHKVPVGELHVATGRRPFCDGSGKRPAKNSSETQVQCRSCERTITVTKAGRLAVHKRELGVRGGTCAGSGTDAKYHLGLAQAVEPGIVICGPGEIDESVDNIGQPATSFMVVGEAIRPLDDQSEQVVRRIQLSDWWREKAFDEIDMVVVKAIEYGATDLRDTGRDIYEMAGRPQPDDATATEAGIAFYVAGKLSRVIAAIREGRQPSLDTWLDIGIYARMAQRVHEAGAWPGV